MKSSLLISLSSALLLPTAASAQLISQDSFSAYTAGLKLPGQNPTVTGYTGAWAAVAFGTAQPAVSAGSLTYGDPTYAVGGDNKVGKAADAAGIGAANSGRTERLLDGSLAVTNSTERTVYLSWLFQTGNENTAAQPNVYQTLALWNGTGATDSLRDFECGIALGDFGTANYGFRVDNNSPANLNVAPDSNVHLIVAKFVLSATDLSDSVTVWIDPVLGAGEPAGGVTISNKNLAFDRIVFSDYASNSAYWDEVRWGNTFANVTTDSVLPASPSFVLQPTDFTGHVNDTVTLNANAIADPTPTYQWEYSTDGTTGWGPITDANAAIHQIFSAAFADNGFYRLVATNGNGSATSDVVQVSLTYPAPTILNQPASSVAQTGTNVTLSVSAIGLGNLSYQWFKDTVAIDGATSDMLELTNVQPGDGGDYEVEITDDAAVADGEAATTALSNIATLSVVGPWSGLVSHEPFDTAAGYVEGQLTAQNPAIGGYAGAWTGVDFGDAKPAVSSGTLTHSNPLYLGSSGAKASVIADSTGGEITAANSGRIYRMFDAPLVVNTNTTGTRYLSFLFQSGQETGATVYQMLSLVSANNGDGVRPFDIGLTNNSGQTGTNYNFGVSGNYVSTGVAADANVHLLVVKFDLSATAASDNVTVWVDPALGSGDPVGGSTVTGVDLDWNKLILSDYEGNSAAWDEIRWGSSFDSVTLNPNPSNTYATWIAGYPGVGSLTGFNDDADGDGIKNGLENLFGTDPSVSSQGIVQVARSGNTVTFQHPANATPAADVSASYVWSTDLAAFHADGASNSGTTVSFATSTVSGTTTVTATITGTIPNKLFLSLKATQGAP